MKNTLLALFMFICGVTPAVAQDCFVYTGNWTCEFTGSGGCHGCDEISTLCLSSYFTESADLSGNEYYGADEAPAGEGGHTLDSDSELVICGVLVTCSNYCVQEPVFGNWNCEESASVPNIPVSVGVNALFDAFSPCVGGDDGSGGPGGDSDEGP